MVMDQKTWELRVDQHLNSIPGSSPNNHIMLDMPLVFYMPLFVFCEINLSLFLGEVFWLVFFPLSTFLVASFEGSRLYSCHCTTERNGSFVHEF